ncbi:MAG: hypothetical protein L7T84_08455 [Akkermansiaceae bacterium]|nr:hypothetical protein [Akkermansiaceae bacterium]
MTGENSDFTIITDPAASVAAGGGTTTFVVRFEPSSTGVKNASLQILSNAASPKDSYDIDVSGTARSGSPVSGRELDDAFGYRATELAGDQAVPFLPVTPTGTTVSPDPDVLDTGLFGYDRATDIDMGFNFSFYQNTYDRCFISTTGVITFGSLSVDYTPEDVSPSMVPNNLIAPFWTDLRMDANSKIVYKKSGVEPSRVLTIKFHNMQQWNNAGRRMTFQVQLYEGTNTIEMQYQSETSSSPYNSNRFTIGIASQPDAIDGVPGVVGINYLSGELDTETSTPSNAPALDFPLAIAFERPVLVNIESRYAKPTVADPSVTEETDVGLLPSLGLDPQIGTVYGKEYGSVARFEAPEFIYLNRNYEELEELGDLEDPDPDKVAYYRLVNDGYAIDGQVVQGTTLFFTTTLTHDVTVIWRWKLEYAAIVEAVGLDGSPLPAGEGVGNPTPALGRHWVPKDTEFAASIDRAVGNDSLGLDVGGFRYTAKEYQLNLADPATFGARVDEPLVSLGPTGNRVSTAPVTVTDWVRLKWTLAAQVRYRFDATGGSQEDGNGDFIGQSFVQIYAPGSQTVIERTVFGNAPFNEVWIDTGRQVVVGAFYRTYDRCFTLTDFPAEPSGDLSSLGTDISKFEDLMVADDATPINRLRVARVYTVPFASGPTEVHFFYAPTVFRAEIPIGMSFDAENPNLQLVPDLCDGGVLRSVGDLGPENTFASVGATPDGPALGQPMRWDQLGQSLFPVHPGSYQLDWPDENNPGTTYKIEIVSGYPGDTVLLSSEREEQLADGNSMREGAPDYVDRTTLPRVGIEFPGSVDAPGDDAHYRHLFDPIPDRQAPTRLDIRTSDHWNFIESPFTDRTAQALVNTGTSGTAFSTSGEGRCVLLYSYRPNPDEAANGDLTEERLAVRVVRSEIKAPILPDQNQWVLGRRGLELGGGASSNDGAFGVIQRPGNPTTASIDHGDNFVVDFWLSAEGLRESAPMTLVNCTTDGTTTVTCDSTAEVVEGMDISGTNVAVGTKILTVVDSTTLILTSPASDSETGHTLSASNKPVTVVSTGPNGLKVTLDPASSTVTASYRGLPVTHALPPVGAEWHHYAIHLFEDAFFNTTITLLDFYVDGVRLERSAVGSLLSSGTSFDVGTGLTADSLLIGSGANPADLLQLDQLRLFALPNGDDPWLTSGEIRLLRNSRVINLRSTAPLLSFNFEAAPTQGSFANSGSSLNVGVGPVASDPSGLFVGTWARLDIQEVATRLNNTLDNANFGGSGYIQNGVSNYNARIYTRNAEVGDWGAIFPVNDGSLYTDADKRLEVAYYENPFLTDRNLHPNVAWPYQAAAYDEVVYPTFGPHKDKAIYIASRAGSEGVDRNGRLQEVFGLDRYADLSIYNQPIRTSPGYNPNEEHAISAGANRAGLKVKEPGEELPNNPPLAAFALQKDINVIDKSGNYTSDPWVLVQVENLETGQTEMAAYEVFKERAGTIPFPRPTDALVNATSGLSYESASAPEDRFLLTDPGVAHDFSYEFKYQAAAGDLLIAPYPLNLVIGNASMADARGKSVQVGGVNQRVLWRDINDNAWVVSGDGRFFHRFFYPHRGDFYLPGGTAVGTPVAWVPENGVGFTGNGRSLNPTKVVYDTIWRSNYPKLKRGETLAYQGGEYFNENPGSNGLPALVAMAAAEIVYDSSTPSMVFGRAGDAATANRYDFSDASARITRPLDRREYRMQVSEMGAAGFSPAETDKIFAIAERWYFKQLPGSLQKRFYYDTLAEKLVYRGLLNDKESGDPELTAGPDPINTLEPNVWTADQFRSVRDLSTDTTWVAAITSIYNDTLNPNGVPITSGGLPFMCGVVDIPDEYSEDLTVFWNEAMTGPVTSPEARAVHLDSFGVGSAFVPNPGLLTKDATGSLYVTIAENNRDELEGAAITLHIIEVIPDRYRGAIKVVEAADAFSERISLQHNGEFGGNTDDLYYEWWIRDTAPLDVVAEEVLADGTLKEFDSQGNTLWQEYLPKVRLENGSLNNFQKHLGLNSVVFEGSPVVTLADKLVLLRYRHRTESNWTLVPFEVTDPVAEWKPGNPAPFQWAGAANSPQLQADGSKRYIPQLVMGWVKRVLDRINPYEARYNDFFSNESPATYSSQIQIAGAPFAGKVALNSQKNVIENTGLIELYETVLQRAKELSIDNTSNPVSTPGINQAILLAATRLSVLYELLAREAYSDAQDSTINVSESEELASVASFTHAFENMEASLLHEELALLRGTDFRKSYPVYNRMFWNYAKGLGEAAYNVNYNIYDENSDGFINEDDARALYPQGHGDSWGHFVNALDKHYALLRQPVFSWQSRSELYSLMQNVLEVDYLDEKTFARLAAGKARAGRDIVRGTYRLEYTQDPDGQWQGYTDGADPARAWGVSEWAHRTGQGAYFDWMVANSLLPEDAGDATPVTDPENLDRIERLGAIDEIGAIAGGLHEIQLAMDEVNKGVNPLGFDSDAVTLDLDLEFYENASGGDRRSHFDQIYTRAVAAGENAMATLDFATKAGNKLMRLAGDTDALIVEAYRQDLDYRNRLIEIFGRPYDGTIGFGEVYPEGYEGPDTQLFAYLDETSIDQLIPSSASDAPATLVTYQSNLDNATGLADTSEIQSIYSDALGNFFENIGTTFTSPFGEYLGVGSQELSDAFVTLKGGRSYEDFTETPPEGEVPIRMRSAYAFQAPEGWGQRTSYGRLQQILEEELIERIALDAAIANYVGFLQDFEVLTNRLKSEINLIDQRTYIATETAIEKLVAELIGLGLDSIQDGLDQAAASTLLYGTAASEGFPKVIGFSNDVTSIGRAGVLVAAASVDVGLSTGKKVLKGVGTAAKIFLEQLVAEREYDSALTADIATLEGLLVDLVSVTGNDVPMRDAIATHRHNIELKRQEYLTAQAEGFRLLREREAFNKILAAKVQKNRYNDMLMRIARNDAMTKYQSAFNNAARYTWLAAKAYDYETSLEEGDPAAAGTFLDAIVKERQLGLWADGQPRSGQGGLAEILHQLYGNFEVLKGQLGIGTPQAEFEKLSLRGELFRIGSDSDASQDRWEDALKARIVPDLTALPEFVSHCRPFSTPAEGPQPGIVIRFNSHVNNGVNFFGHSLAPGDHSYSTANYATKIRGVGVWLENYNEAGLATTPRAYLVPVGNDYLRTSGTAGPQVRSWNIQEQRIPTPFTINTGNLSAPGYIPNLTGVDGSFGQLRRHGDFRIFHDSGDPEADDGEVILSSRLIGRSVWNSDWMLIIPGANLHADPMTGLNQLSETINDIKLHFTTYSHSGQ